MSFILTHAHLISSLSIVQAYYSWCRGWYRELVVLSEDEVEQLGEEERHRHLSDASACTDLEGAALAAYQAGFSAAALAAMNAATVTTSCYAIEPL